MSSKMKIEEFVHHSFSFDILMEAFAAELFFTLNQNVIVDQENHQATHFNENNFHVSPVGRDSRKVGDDIHSRKFVLRKNRESGQTELNIDIAVNRESIYESLPQKFFDVPDEDNPKLKDGGKPSLHPRQFFLPFEQALYQARIAIAILERQTFSDFSIPIKKLWNLEILAKDVVDYRTRYRLDSKELLALHFLLPLSKDICFNKSKLEDTLGLFIGEKVKIKKKKSKRHLVPDFLTSNVGNAVLGENFVLGSSFRNGIPGMEIQVLEVDPSRVEDEFIIPSERNKKFFLEDIAPKYFIPMEIEWEIAIFTRDIPEDFTLSSFSFTSILGYTTKL
jgi:hypothetical protein